MAIGLGLPLTQRIQIGMREFHRRALWVGTSSILIMLSLVIAAQPDCGVSMSVTIAVGSLLTGLSLIRGIAIIATGGWA